MYPRAFIKLMDFAFQFGALLTPIRNCNMFVNNTMNFEGYRIPTINEIVYLLIFPIPIAGVLIIRDKMWKMWDPFQKGVDMQSWSLGIARMIDALVNDYDYSVDRVILPHAYIAGKSLGREEKEEQARLEEQFLEERRQEEQFLEEQKMMEEQCAECTPSGSRSSTPTPTTEPPPSRQCEVKPRRDLRRSMSI